MDTKKAVSISGFTILTGSIVRFIFTFKHKHPNKNATCIEYGLTNVMLPTVLLGSTIGVFLNMLLPSIILQFTLALLLVGLCIQSIFKAKNIYDNESEKMSVASNEHMEADGPSQVPIMKSLDDITELSPVRKLEKAQSAHSESNAQDDL
jgi:uncharacterized membrane protein YfcA